MSPPSRSPRRWLFLVPLGIGVAAAVWLLRSGQDPEHLPEREVARPVRVIEAPSLAAVPRAVGYGSVEPGTTWQAIAEVGGRVVEVHDRLEVGAILRAGAVLLRIDRADYDLALAEAKADHQATEAQLAELAAREENARASLAIEREAFDLAIAELERQEKLAAQGAVSRSALETQKRSTLAQRQRVQAEANVLNLVPAERQVLQARLERLRSLILAAERDVERTTVILPFDGRIAALATELGQVATPGQVLVEADGITVAEVAAQVPISHMRGLVPAADSLGANITAGNLSDLFTIRATVRHPEVTGVWPARFARVSPTIDPRTRTVGIIVEVDEPYRRAQPGVRPPLVKGMFVEVVLSGRPRDAVVIPSGVVHGGAVYVAADGDRLARRPVEVSLSQPSFLVVAKGIEAGDRVVVSDLFPAIEGMLLDPVDDVAALAALAADATGAAP